MRVEPSPLPSFVPIASAGCLAWDALAASDGRVRLLSALDGAAYVEAGAEIVGVGRDPKLRHARSILLAAALPTDWAAARLEVGAIEPWRPRWPERIAGGAPGLAQRAAALGAATVAAATGELPGFGPLLAGLQPAFPLAASTHAAAAVATAAQAGDAAALSAAAAPLIGLGPGLTPSGDDYLAGVLIALRLRACAEPALTAPLDALTASVPRAAEGRTNRISAALLADAARGYGFAACHALGQALAEANRPASEATARRLVALGHSSGWDILTGLVAGLVGPHVQGTATGRAMLRP